MKVISAIVLAAMAAGIQAAPTPQEGSCLANGQECWVDPLPGDMGCCSGLCVKEPDAETGTCADQ